MLYLLLFYQIMKELISGFSKKSKEEKIDWLVSQYLSNIPDAITILKEYWNDNAKLQKLHDGFIENTISNYYLPFAVAPNFLINNKMYTIPMVLEESSVVAAASHSAKFWLNKGGFTSKVISTVKNGQIHINYYGNPKHIEEFFTETKPKFLASISEIEKNMKKRGGGLLDLVLINKTEELEGYYQLHATFETNDAMGANFINTCLETISKCFAKEAVSYSNFLEENSLPEVVMSILSNYVPECIVRAQVQCKVEELATEGINGNAFAKRFIRAIEIAKVEKRRAVTHNKGIMNGIDAVILATGNDFRSIEAGVHAYAAKDGNYTSLTNATLIDDVFTFSIEIPLAIGTVGGLTSLHPLAKLGLSILKNPSAKELMQIMAVAGLAQNFAALRALTTTGIQKGHMKMHLMNILNNLNANPNEIEKASNYFSNHTISHSEVVSFIEELRN